MLSLHYEPRCAPSRTRTCAATFGEWRLIPLTMGACVRERGIEPLRRSHGVTARWAHHLPNSRLGCLGGIEPTCSLDHSQSPRPIG